MEPKKVENAFGKRDVNMPVERKSGGKDVHRENKW